MNIATLNQVAIKAGVSKTTASLVLNGKADSVNIAQATRQRVIETAKSLNYKPGKFSPGKLNGQSGIIGLFAHDFTTKNNGRWLQCLIKAAEEKGYVILPRMATSKTLIQKIRAIPFDAVIVTQKDLLNDKTNLDIPEVPLLCAGFIPDAASIQSIAADVSQHTNELIQKLYRHNKKAIGMLCTNKKSEEQKKKTETYKENYCERFEIAPNIVELSSPDITGKRLKEACHSLIEKGANGIIFETPEMATLALREPEIRHQGQNGIMFAAYDKIDGSELLPGNLFIYTTPEIEEMSKLVMKTIVR